MERLLDHSGKKVIAALGMVLIGFTSLSLAIINH